MKIDALVPPLGSASNSGAATKASKASAVTLPSSSSSNSGRLVVQLIAYKGAWVSRVLGTSEDSECMAASKRMSQRPRT